MTSVTLKIRLRTPGQILVFVLPWCFCVPNLVRIHQIVLQVLSGNHISYLVALNDLRDLENKVKVTRFKLGFRHALMLPCTRFGEHTSNISSDIKQKPFLINSNGLLGLEIKVKITKFNLCFHLALVPLCTEFGEITSDISYNILRKPSSISSHPK